MRGFRVPGWQRTRCIIVPTVLRGAERIRRMIYIARAQGGRFFARIFFVFLARGSSVLGLKTMLKVGFVVHFCQKKTRFSKKTSKNLIGCHPLSRSFSLLLGD